MNPKYVVVKEYFHGCPAHDLIRYSHLQFFETLEQVMSNTLADSAIYKTNEVYDIETQAHSVGVEYKFYSHSIEEIKFSFKDGSSKCFKPHEYEPNQWQLKE